MSIEEIESIKDLLDFAEDNEYFKILLELATNLQIENERLNKCLDEIDLIIYRLRFVEFLDDKACIGTLNNILNDIRKICQTKDINKVDELKKR